MRYSGAENNERLRERRLLFLAPERSRVSSSRDELVGDALVLADRGRFTYDCEIDTRRGQVLEASIARR